MSINVPSFLLRHANSLKLSIQVASFSDRQLNNIAKQVLTGQISRGESATSRLALHIAKEYDSPHILLCSWSIRYNDLETTHPLFDAMIQGCALTKLEDTKSWYTNSITETMNDAEKRMPSGSFQTYWLSTEAKKHIKKAAKVTVPDDHQVRGFIAQLLNRELDTIELDLKND
jgi:hypothetical protein